MNYRPSPSGTFRTKPTNFKKTLEKIERKYPTAINTIDVGPWLVGFFVIAAITIILIKL